MSFEFMDPPHEHLIACNVSTLYNQDIVVQETNLASGLLRPVNNIGPNGLYCANLMIANRIS
ncbi:876_t:CDS:2 [Funneliformis geosporum]|uniref:876_t:CDS:1 n=1 Tax=Funneliformis geosporum TaxID=1117311 RepID=A0A9W4SD29_9GLOM|nr:876_t:CDS:2 [Funneliformis geosporum]